MDKATGEVLPVTKTNDKWRISTDSKAKYRYFTREQVEKALLRKRLEAIPKKEFNRRNNVEAAMFQISYHTRNNKTRYRGLVKHVMWACSRCMWMNFIRLMIFQTTTSQRTLFSLFWAIWKRLQSHLAMFRESRLKLPYILTPGDGCSGSPSLPLPYNFIHLLKRTHYSFIGKHPMQRKIPVQRCKNLTRFYPW